MTGPQRPAVARGWLVERVERGTAHLCRGANTRDEAISQANWLRDYHRDYRMKVGRVRVRRVLVQDLNPRHCPCYAESECPYGFGSNRDCCRCNPITQLWQHVT